MAWTDERIDRLKTLWTQGMTASQIADELGGISRNAVIGKAHRLGLEARPSPVRGAEPGDEVELPPVASESDELDAFKAPPESAEASDDAPVSVAAPDGIAPDDDAEPSPAPPAAAPAPAFVGRSIGPGGFERQMPGEGQSPIPPAPPRRLVPAKPSSDIAGKTSLLELNDRICKWPLGHPGEPDFHFCGDRVNPGFPYCLDHCSVAYQAQLPRRDRRPPPPMPYGGPRVR